MHVLLQYQFSAAHADGCWGGCLARGVSVHGRFGRSIYWGKCDSLRRVPLGKALVHFPS